jgi:hypothetical protein
MKPSESDTTFGLHSARASTFIASGLLAAWGRIEARSKELAAGHREPEYRGGGR